MAEDSFPVVEQPMSAEQWKSVTLGIGDGVLDEGGSPYTFQNASNVDNTAEIAVSTSRGTASAILKGHYHRIDENVTVSLPAVTAATTYHIALQYDPLRADMPVQLVVVTSLDRSSGKEYLPLYEVDRAPNQLLTDAARRWVRPRISPVMTVSRGRELPVTRDVMRWTLGMIHGGTLEIPDLRVNTESGWESVLTPEWENLPNTTSGTNMSSGRPKSIQRVGTTRKMRGRFQRASGAPYLASNLDGYIVNQLDARDVPPVTSRHMVFANGGVPAYMVLYAGESQIRIHVAKDATWIDLGTIEWQVEEMN